MNAKCPFVNLLLQDRYLIKDKWYDFSSNAQSFNKYFKATDLQNQKRSVLIKISADLPHNLKEYGLLRSLNKLESTVSSNQKSFLTVLGGGEFMIKQPPSNTA